MAVNKTVYMLSYMSTPDFSPWSGHFAAQGQRWRTTPGPSVHQLERLCSDWIPRWRPARQEDGAHSRNRRWNLRLVFWSFLWQISQAGAPCREAIRQAKALCLAGGATSTRSFAPKAPSAVTSAAGGA